MKKEVPKLYTGFDRRFLRGKMDLYTPANLAPLREQAQLTIDALLESGFLSNLTEKEQIVRLTTWAHQFQTRVEEAYVGTQDWSQAYLSLALLYANSTGFDRALLGQFATLFQLAAEIGLPSDRFGQLLAESFVQPVEQRKHGQVWDEWVTVVEDSLMTETDVPEKESDAATIATEVIFEEVNNQWEAMRMEAEQNVGLSILEGWTAQVSE